MKNKRYLFATISIVILLVSCVTEEDTETIWSPNGYKDTGIAVPVSAFVNGTELGCTFDYGGHNYIITKIFYPSENARDMTGRSNWQVYDLTENHYYYFLNTLSGQSSREGIMDDLVLYLYDAY